MAEADLANMPWLISIDDHVTEPPDLWTSRLSSKFLERGPQVRRGKILAGADAREGKTSYDHPGGKLGDYWVFDGQPTKGYLMPITHAVGFDDKKIGTTPLTYDEIWPGAWKKTERLGIRP